MSQFTARAYNHFEVKGNKVIKSSNTERLLDEIFYYEQIKKTELGDLFPDYFSIKFDKPYSIELEYFEINHLSNYDDRIYIALERMSKNRTNGCSLFRKQMYLDKTLKYQKELMDNEFFADLNKYDTLNINGKKCRNFDNLKDDLQKSIESLLINSDDFTVIHGDLCYSNVLANGKLIDPRGSFGKKGIYGDPLYDIAKLRHSQHGRYEQIINDNFSVSCNYYNVEFNLKPDFDLDLPNYNSDKVKLIEGLIFIGMCSRHYDSLLRQIVMYSTGIKILNEVLNT